MAHLIYTQEFQDNVIADKSAGMKVSDLCKKYNIAVYTLYKILHLNDVLPIPSQATEGLSPVEGVEHRNLSPNNNNSQERPTPKWYASDRHRKVPHNCMVCSKIFMARDRGVRTKFCSKKCQDLYIKQSNGFQFVCSCCGKSILVKNSLYGKYIYCKECRNIPRNNRHVKDVLSNSLIVELDSKHLYYTVEQRFDWLADPTKKISRLRLDFYFPDRALAIEIHGKYHVSGKNFLGIPQRDILKHQLCSEHGIKIIYINYSDPVDSVLEKIYAELQGKTNL